MSQSVVYFVQPADGGPIKIGVALDGHKRLLTLQAQSPVPLVCLATMPGYFNEERALHRQFAAKRLHGEWFEDHPELQAFIASIRSGAVAGALLMHTTGRARSEQPLWRKYLRMQCRMHQREAVLRDGIAKLESEERDVKERLSAPAPQSIPVAADLSREQATARLIDGAVDTLESYCSDEGLGVALDVVMASDDRKIDILLLVDSDALGQTATVHVGGSRHRLLHLLRRHVTYVEEQAS